MTVKFDAKKKIQKERCFKENKKLLAFVLIFHGKLIPTYGSLKFHCAS